MKRVKIIGAGNGYWIVVAYSRGAVRSSGLLLKDRAIRLAARCLFRRAA